MRWKETKKFCTGIVRGKRNTTVRAPPTTHTHCFLYRAIGFRIFPPEFCSAFVNVYDIIYSL